MESFSYTDSNLVNLATNGDRDAIIEVCELIALRIKISNQWFLNGFCRIGKEGENPNQAFEWEDRKRRQNLMIDARLLKDTLLPSDIHNDSDLYKYTMTIFTQLAVGREPIDAFHWRQKRGGRVLNINIYRDWDICQTFYELRRDGYSREQALTIVSNITNLGLKSVEQITRSITADKEPAFPDNIFPMTPTSKLIKRCDIDNEISKILINNE